MRFIHRLIVMALAAGLLAACGQPTTQSTRTTTGQVGKTVSVASAGTYTDILPTELYSMLQQKDFVFVNVHIPFEGDIANTDVSFPYNEIDQNLAKLPADKNAKIVLYCRSGRMSTEAAHALVKRGYTNLYQLDGGMVAWEKAGYPLVGK